ncbi:hypothetical protein [Antarctobacter sp.]|uniref:hypothetical protein n=1 Tax=Antarctobacter sp. TaxID=1872577 RepID=UPI003A9203E0
MFDVKAICDGRITLACVSNPFSMVEASAALDRIRSGEIAGADMASPVLVDVRTVRLALLPTSEFVTYFRHRARGGIARSGNLMACLCDDSGSFGMLRMFGIMADLEGVRPEDNYFVTESLEEAALWLTQRAGVDDAVRADIIAETEAFRASLSA